MSLTRTSVPRQLLLAAGILISTALPKLSFCQQTSATDRPVQPGAAQPGALHKEDDNSSEVPSKRIFFIIPNFRSSPSLKSYSPLTPREKFKIARQDSFDRGTVALAGLFAGQSQLTNSTPSFGQGVAGYGRYFATSYADFVIGDYLTEGVYPTLLHQDPRYFRKGQGSRWARLGYAAGQIFWTHTDNGGTQFNYSEVIGNSTAVAISNAYYPDNRTVSNGISKLGTQLGVDMASNILKEFAPDISRKFSRKHRDAQGAGR